MASKKFAAVSALATTALIGGAIAFAGTASAATATSETRLYASDDAYTSSARPTTNFGQDVKLAAGTYAGDKKVTYLKFTVGKLASGATLTGAQLRLVTDGHPVPGTLSLYRVTSTTWSESTLTKTNAPALGAFLSSVRPSSTDTLVTFNLGQTITKAGAYSFALTDSATNDVARFNSVEYGDPATGGAELRLAVSQTVATPAPSTKPPTPVPSTTAPAPSPSTKTPTPAPGTTSPTPSPTTPAPTTPAPCTVNTKLVPSCGILWGAAAGGFSDTPRDQALKDWETLTGRTANIYHTYHVGDESFPTTAEIAMASDPAKPRLLMLNWKVDAGYSWTQVAAGAADARIDKEAAYLKAKFTQKFFLVIHHEPDNDVDNTAGSGHTAADYAAMFRHTVDRLRADGVTNAVYTLTYMSYEKWNNQSWWYDLYPGDNWVDWITLDAYVNADPAGFHHGELTDLVNRTTDPTKFPGFYTWATSQHPNKPFMVSEWGVFEYTADPAQKAAIYAKVLRQLKQYPAIKGLMYFDAQNAPGAPGDLRVNSSNLSLTEFKKIAADPIFNVQIR